MAANASAGGEIMQIATPAGKTYFNQTVMAANMVTQQLGALIARH